MSTSVQLLASITYTANGTQRVFAIPFDYLRSSFIHVSINDVEATENLTIANRQVTFDTAPANGAKVTITRTTPYESVVSWSDGSILKAQDMTISQVQNLHLIEEQQDYIRNNSLGLDDTQRAWAAMGKPFGNLADPTEPQDAVTKHYMESVQDGFVARIENLNTTTTNNINSTATNAINTVNNTKTTAVSEINTLKSQTEAAKNTAVAAQINTNTYKQAAETAKDNCERIYNNLSYIGTPIGHIRWTLEKEVAPGELPLLGGLYSRTTYADLWNWIQQHGRIIDEVSWQNEAQRGFGDVGLFSRGDGATTFRLPRITKFIEGTDVYTSVGYFTKAGLPNITASTESESASNGAIQGKNPTATGAFTTKRGSVASWSGSTVGTFDLGFDASLSNPIYGASNTVQPNSIRGMWVIKAFGTVGNVGTIDYDTLVNTITNVELKRW